jgi:hypothetical protein
MPAAPSFPAGPRRPSGPIDPSAPVSSYSPFFLKFVLSLIFPSAFLSSAWEMEEKTESVTKTLPMRLNIKKGSNKEFRPLFFFPLEKPIDFGQ